MGLEIVIHSVGEGTCSLTGKEGEGIVVTFKDEDKSESFLSHKGFLQLVKYRLKAVGKTVKGGPNA